MWDSGTCSYLSRDLGRRVLPSGSWVWVGGWVPGRERENPCFEHRRLQISDRPKLKLQGKNRSYASRSVHHAFNPESSTPKNRKKWTPRPPPLLPPPTHNHNHNSPPPNPNNHPPHQPPPQPPPRAPTKSAASHPHSPARTRTATYPGTRARPRSKPPSWRGRRRSCARWGAGRRLSGRTRRWWSGYGRRWRRGRGRGGRWRGRWRGCGWRGRWRGGFGGS